MIGLYRQSVAKIQMKKSKQYKEEKFTGHEKYYQRENTGKKGKKKGIKESKSTSEIETKERDRSTATRSCNSDQMIKVCRSDGSITSDNLRKAPGKFESLAKLFFCVAGEPPTPTPSRVPNYAYSALEAEYIPFRERIDPSKKIRDRAASICCQYLRMNPRYKLIEQLNDIGSRVEKHWFIVRDTLLKTERLLALLPCGTNCPVQGNAESRSLILDVLLALQHPYVYPVLDINFRLAGSKSYAFITIPLNLKGSLKDFIYQSQWQDEWNKKYSNKSSGLPIVQVQRLGRQIIEALIFLRRKGFPPSGHFHSGNIILQNGVARLSGLENTVLGFTSRTQPVLWPRAHVEPAGIDSLSFGHVLFEMCAGYELDTPNPTPGNILDIYQYPQVIEVLEYIFENPEMRIPAIEELLFFDFFRNIDLREIRNQAQSTPVFKTEISEKGFQLLNELRIFQVDQMKRFKTEIVSLPFCDSDSTISSHIDRSTSGVESELDMDDDAYDADAASDQDTVPIGEHRSLSLHTASMNRVTSLPSLYVE